MTRKSLKRRDFLQVLGAAAVALPAGALGQGRAADKGAQPVRIGIEPKFELSPYLYMQFMEPLGVTDGSVSAAWDYLNDRWREDVVETTHRLAPAMLRWGGIFCSYYRWQEGVGPRQLRKPMLNIQWGGMESNQVGTLEFVDFCRRVGAEPLVCVNFEAEERKRWAVTPQGDIRSGLAEEARRWVDYCNNPANAERIGHGQAQPCKVKFWQIGNETSYGKEGFDCETAARKTVEFARRMRQADPSIQLIGWGDSDWAARMLKIAGDQLQFLAFHHMFNPDREIKDSPLRGIEYRKDPARTWEHLMNAYKVHEARIVEMRQQVSGTNVPLALTECHFALPGRNRCEVLSTWAAGVADARLLNVHERHGDILKIATLADFCGTRWQVNAVMIPVPGGQSYLMPVALVMQLYRRHTGEKALEVVSAPAALDVTASRTGSRVYLHVVNTDRTAAVSSRLAVDGSRIVSGRAFELAADPTFEVMDTTWKELAVQEKAVPADLSWTFPPASVSALELDIEQA
ncbi:MAG: alpha-L-arabinofuranosidase C-terminal domain-containing protein [Candidatus Glassbacteria bacterium]